MHSFSELAGMRVITRVAQAVSRAEKKVRDPSARETPRGSKKSVVLRTESRHSHNMDSSAPLLQSMKGQL